MLYHVRENQHPYAYHSLYLSFFLPIIFFITDLSAPMRDKVFKFVDVCCVKENIDAEIYFSFFSFFSSPEPKAQDELL